MKQQQHLVPLHDALKSNAAISNNQTFVPGGTWLALTTVMTARIVKITVKYDF